MIEPITKTSSVFFQTSSPFQSHQPPLPISSLSSLNPIHWLVLFFRLLKRFICCERHPKSIPSKMKHSPEIDPNILSLKDPFRNELFTFDPQGKFSFRDKEAFEKTSEIFHILGTSGYLSWIPKVFSLTQKENRVKELNDSAPLAFLYYIFCNRAHTEHILHFKKEALKGKWILQWKTGRDPWDEFLTLQTKNFEKSPADRAKIPGFCKALGLEEEPFLALAKEKKWRELILSVFEKRLEHFSLSQ